TKRGGGRDCDLKTLGSASADPALRIPRLVERRDGDPLPRAPGVDEPTIADIDPVVAKAVEEHQVPRLQSISGNRHAKDVLLRGIVRRRDAPRRVHVLNEP